MCSVLIFYIKFTPLSHSLSPVKGFNKCMIVNSFCHTWWPFADDSSMSQLPFGNVWKLSIHLLCRYVMSIHRWTTTISDYNCFVFMTVNTIMNSSCSWLCQCTTTLTATFSHLELGFYNTTHTTNIRSEPTKWGMKGGSSANKLMSTHTYTQDISDVFRPTLFLSPHSASPILWDLPHHWLCAMSHYFQHTLNMLLYLCLHH